jgi:hypothetical protein
MMEREALLPQLEAFVDRQAYKTSDVAGWCRASVVLLYAIRRGPSIAGRVHGVLPRVSAATRAMLIAVHVLSARRGVNRIL